MYVYINIYIYVCVYIYYLVNRVNTACTLTIGFIVWRKVLISQKT